MQLAIPQKTEGTDPLNGYIGLFIKQPGTKCCQICCGGTKTEYNIVIPDDPSNDIFYALENSSCLSRCCCCKNRPFTINLYSGTSASGPMIASFERSLSCPVMCCKCCCYQTLRVKSSSGDIGQISETCWCCVPNFRIKTASGVVQYNIHQDTCCFGICVNYLAQAWCNRNIPFYIYDTNRDEDGKHVGKIVNVSAGGYGGELAFQPRYFDTQVIYWHIGKRKNAPLINVFQNSIIYYAYICFCSVSPARRCRRENKNYWGSLPYQSDIF